MGNSRKNGSDNVKISRIMTVMGSNRLVGAQEKGFIGRLTTS